MPRPVGLDMTAHQATVLHSTDTGARRRVTVPPSSCHPTEIAISFLCRWGTGGLTVVRPWSDRGLTVV